jgi:hypothetical protein
MKKIMKNNRIIAIALLTLFSATAFAGNNSFGKEKEPTPVEFKFIGLVNEQAVFELKVAADESASDYTITITDEAGSTYYRENIKATQLFSKKFLFTEEISDNKLLLTVTCRNNKKAVVYKIEDKHNYSRETVVSEVSNY